MNRKQRNIFSSWLRTGASCWDAGLHLLNAVSK